MRYHVEPGATGTGIVGGNTWASAGDLDATLNYVINRPTRGGDEIWALQGTYNLTAPLVINNNTAPLSIYGGFRGTENTLCDRNANINSMNPNFFPNASILDGGGGNTIIQMYRANVCRIDGFVLKNGNAGAWITGGNNGGGVCATSSDNVWFENIVFMDNAAVDYGGGMYTAGVPNLMIKNTIFFRNQATDGGGLGINDGGNTMLVNLLFNANQTNGGNGNAIYIINNDNLKIINNTIADNYPVSSPSVYCDHATTVDIYNSILYPDSLAAAGNAIVTVDSCLLGSNPTNIPPAPPITIQVPPNLPIGTNPNFVNSAGGNFHLQPGSQCIDAGNTNLIFPYSATDLEGRPRFMNNRGVAAPFPLMKVDMGAFEVQ